MTRNSETYEIVQSIETIYNRKKLPDASTYLPLLKDVGKALDNESELIRPRDKKGLPGGLIRLKPIETIIVPDLHARMDFIVSLLQAKDFNDHKVIDRLIDGDLQILCVGDGFHGEARVRNRWLKAYEEFQTGFKRHKAMDEEMRESLGLMEMIMLLKITFPENFHFLKGNHENIANENGQGNYPFGKFAMEGQMVTDYVLKFLGKDFFEEYYEFEKKLPLLAVGNHFVVTHAEPARFFSTDEVINFRYNEEVVYGLTWTGNDEAASDSVSKGLEHYLGTEEGCFHFGGHRPIAGNYFTRSEGRYIQIHNPNRFVVAWLPWEGTINLDTHIFEIANIKL